MGIATPITFARDDRKLSLRSHHRRGKQSLWGHSRGHVIISAMDLAGKNIMVTGGLGFIGSNLAIRLVKMGANVTIVDAKIPDTGWNSHNIVEIKNKVKVVEANIADPEVARLIRKSEYVFNLAGVLSHVDAMKDPVFDLQINTVDQLKFLMMCIKENKDIKIIYTGTRNQYGRIDKLFIDESYRFDPIDTNGISEIAGEAYHKLYWKLNGIRSTSLRLCNVFGPRHQMRHSRQGVLNWFIRRLIDNEKIQLMGDGSQIRDCVYVEDVVDALIDLATTSDLVWGEAFNIGAFPVSLKEFSQKAIEANGSGEYELVPFPSERKSIEPGNYVANWDKLKKTVGWTPKYSLDLALAETFEYYRLNKAKYW